MSNDKSVPAVTTVPADVPETTPTETKQPNPVVRAYRKIRATPPKTAIAVVGGVALVGAGAFLGRKSASYHVEVVEDDFEPEPVLLLNDQSEDSVA